MYCVKVEKSLRLLKYETIAWLVIGVVHDESILCDEMKHGQTIQLCRDKFSLAMVF